MGNVSAHGCGKFALESHGGFPRNHYPPAEMSFWKYIGEFLLYKKMREFFSSKPEKNQTHPQAPSHNYNLNEYSKPFCSSHRSSYQPPRYTHTETSYHDDCDHLDEFDYLELDRDFDDDLDDW